MTQRLPKLLIGAIQLPNAAPGSPQYTVPANTTTTVSSILLNSTGASGTVTIHAVPPGGAIADTNEIVSTVTVPATGAPPTTLNLAGLNLPAGYDVYVYASAATLITAYMSGYETT